MHVSNDTYLCAMHLYHWDMILHHIMKFVINAQTYIFDQNN